MVEDAVGAAWGDEEGALAAGAGAGEETGLVAGLATGGVEEDADAAVSAVTI
jgi:hypothetical protein